MVPSSFQVQNPKSKNRILTAMRNASEVSTEKPLRLAANRDEMLAVFGISPMDTHFVVRDRQQNKAV